MRKPKLLSIISLILINVMILSNTACNNKAKKTEEKQKINAHIDIKDRETLDVIRTLFDDYKKEKKNTELVFNSPLGGDKLEEDIVKGNIDILVVSRDKMIELSKKGLLKEMGDFYSKNKINEKYYNISAAYGRIGDKYFGVSLMPNTIEAIYNPEALKKLNIDPPTNIQGLMDTLKKLAGANIKVPVLLPEGIDVKNIPTAVIMSNTIDMTKVEEAYGCKSDGYSKLQMQAVFDTLHSIVSQGYIKEESFEVATESTIKRAIAGDIPMFIATSSFTKEIKEEKEVKLEVVKDYNISETKNNIPVISNGVLSTPANTKNEEAVNDLLDYIYGEETQKKLTKLGYVTASKDVNKEAWKEGPQKDIADHLEKADSNSIFYLDNFPADFHPHLETATINILKGKYNGKEWSEILEKACK